MGVFPLQVKVGCCQSGGSPTILVGHPLLWWVSTSIPFCKRLNTFIELFGGIRKTLWQHLAKFCYKV